VNNIEEVDLARVDGEGAGGQITRPEQQEPVPRIEPKWCAKWSATVGQAY
jgi:hypothetical protein